MDFNRSGFFLDEEIDFLNVKILDMENELIVSNFERVYLCLNVIEL